MWRWTLPRTATVSHILTRACESSYASTLQALVLSHRHYLQLVYDCFCCYPSWKGDIVFGLSVCPSVCPGRSFSHFVRVTPPTVFTTHKPNLYHLKAGCLECVMGGGPFFRTPQNFGKIGLWKRPKITNSNFWSVISQRVLGPGMRYPYHRKALLP